jgi:glyoxylase-like metal-dependent hydrolase (beta-lactamase superfamily II)
MKFIGILFAIFSAFALTISGQSVTQDSYAKARPILDRAVAAYGGVKDLRAIENVTFRAEGDTVHRNQSKRTFMSERTPYKASFIIDPKNTRYRQQQDGWYPGGFHWVNGFAINKTEGVSWDALRGTMNPIPNVPAPNFRSRLRMFPHFIILNALERSSRLRYLGNATFDGRAHSVVSYANEDGLEISLYIDDKTSLLSKIETLGTDAYSGDVVNESIFTGYRQDGARMIPTGRVDRRGGEALGDVKYLDVVFNAALTDDNFKLPDGLRTATAAPAAQPSVKYSDNIYTVNASGYNVLAVGFKDHVFVMETPNGDATSKQAIAEIKKIFPGKPIKYVAVTHHHDDHAGGIRTYIAEGATLLGLPGEKTFFEKVVKSTFTIDPDSLTLAPQALKWEPIEKGRRVLTDGTTTVELIDIGPGGHTDEMLVAYFPAEKIIFQGDLLNRPANNDPATINDTTVHFSTWLDSSKLDVERVLGVHGPPSSRAELKQGVAQKQKEKAAEKRGN